MTAPALDTVLDELDAYLADREDVLDGHDGQPVPNEAMNLLRELRDARLAQPAGEAVSEAMVRAACTAYNAAAVNDGEDGQWLAQYGWMNEAIAAALTAPRAEAGDAQDAARWRALIGCDRVRVLGSAGLHSDTDPYGNPHNGYAHIGLELWTKHLGRSYPEAIADLTRFADKAVAALTQEQPHD